MDEEKELLAKINANVEKQLNEKTAESKTEVETLKTEVAALKEVSKTVETLKAELIEAQVQLKAQKEDKKDLGEKKLSLAAELKEKGEKLKNMLKGSDPSAELSMKALTLRSFIANNETAYDLPDIGQLAHRKLSMYDIFPKLNLGPGQHNGVIRYYDWDEDTIARAAAAVAEGAAFPESTAKWKKGSVVLQKIGDTLPVTEEFFEDETLFAAELDMFLQTNVALEIDRQLADGDGSSNTIVGLKSSVNAYTLPGTGTVANATIYDLLVKLSEAITTTGGAKYMPDFVVMNIADINKMKLSKDLNGNYILPPFVSRDGNQVGTINVIEANIITANTLVIGDRRFARIYEMGGIVLSKGLINAQFTEDEMTLKARKRLAFLIRTADKGGFLKVTDIDAAVAAITIV